ncbi:MAG: tRNA lysidine(34) synthetase TilS [Bacilli bacterium]
MNYQKFEGKKVLLAVSTGVDSMVLLHMFMQINCEVYIIYVRHHHRVRVYIENEFFTKFCERNNLHLTTYDYYHVDGNFESVAREYRYRCFKEVYDKYECDFLLTAHHGDDLVETMLMRQLRGTDLNGVGGIREYSYRFGMNIFRPLIEYSKLDIREYANQHNLSYFEDETNMDVSYRRNFLRHEIIPKFGRGYVKKFNNLSRELYELSDYVNSVVNSHIVKYNDIYLNVSDLDKKLFKYGIKNCLKLLYESNINVIYDKHVNLILKMKENDKIELPCTYFVFFKNNKFVFSKCVDEVYQYEYMKNLKVSFLNSKLKFIGEKTLYLDEEIKYPLKIKNANLNWVIENKNGSQKLNRVFINAKVPIHKRKSWPVLIDSNGVVICVFGVKYSKYCLKNTNNYKYMIQYSCDFKGDDL